MIEIFGAISAGQIIHIEEVDVEHSELDGIILRFKLGNAEAPIT